VRFRAPLHHGFLEYNGFEERKQIFRPLIPDVDFTFNNEADLAKITTRTAGIVLETIQGGAGFIQPHNDLKSSCPLYRSRRSYDIR
jgi:acetylornithine/succinyldiaminopimelate/putrescine aminotransferase